MVDACRYLDACAHERPTLEQVAARWRRRRDRLREVALLKQRLRVLGAGASDETLAQPHARPMDFTGRPMAGWVYVAAAGVAEDAALREWVEAGARFARSLPAKG